MHEFNFNNNVSEIIFNCSSLFPLWSVKISWQKRKDPVEKN